MQEALRARFPNEISKIIISYVEVLKHPLEHGFCGVCGIPCKGYTSLCEAHQNICALCLDRTGVDWQYVSGTCKVKYNTDKWWDYAFCATNADIFVEMYRHNEFPIDIEYLSETAENLQEYRDAHENKFCDEVDIWYLYHMNEDNLTDTQMKEYRRADRAAERLRETKPKYVRTDKLFHKL